MPSASDWFDKFLPGIMRCRLDDLVLETPEELVVLGEEHLLRQIFWNLSRNALQAMPNGGRICISAYNCELADGEHLVLPAGRYVGITVTDTGTNPILADTDSDGLADGVETNDDTLDDAATDTGTSPVDDDSDDDSDDDNNGPSRRPF